MQAKSNTAIHVSLGEVTELRQRTHDSKPWSHVTFRVVFPSTSSPGPNFHPLRFEHFHVERMQPPVFGAFSQGVKLQQKIFLLVLKG